MADRQTNGRLYKNWHNYHADLPRLSQLPVGDGIHFDIVTINEAQDIYRTYMKQLQEWLQLAQEQSIYVFKVRIIFKSLYKFNEVDTSAMRMYGLSCTIQLQRCFSVSIII